MTMPTPACSERRDGDGNGSRQQKHTDLRLVQGVFRPFSFHRLFFLAPYCFWWFCVCVCFPLFYTHTHVYIHIYTHTYTCVCVCVRLCVRLHVFCLPPFSFCQATCVQATANYGTFDAVAHDAVQGNRQRKKGGGGRRTTEAKGRKQQKQQHKGKKTVKTTDRPTDAQNSCANNDTKDARINKKEWERHPKETTTKNKSQRGTGRGGRGGGSREKIVGGTESKRLARAHEITRTHILRGIHAPKQKRKRREAYRQHLPPTHRAPLCGDRWGTRGEGCWW